MRNIGKRLKEERIRRGITLEELSRSTLITARRLNAIEEGNIEYFHDDTSILRVYVRSYAKEMHIDYAELKDELEASLKAYDEAIDHSVVTRKDQPEEIRTGDRKGSEGKKPFRLDMTQFGTALTVMALIALIFYVMIRFVLPSMRIIDEGSAPAGREDGNSHPSGEVSEFAPVEVQKISDRIYEVAGWQPGEPLSVKVVIGEKSTYIGKYTVNGEEKSEPASREYLPEEECEFICYPSLDDEIVLHMQSVYDNEIFVNNQKIEIDEQYAGSSGGLQMYFRMVSELSEIKTEEEEVSEDEPTE